jgi:hypothetical protein
LERVEGIEPSYSAWKSGNLVVFSKAVLTFSAWQGEIILRKPWMRVVFVAGLVGCVLLVLGIRLAAGL